MTLSTPITEFRGLKPEEINRLTPKAKQLTLGDLIKLNRSQTDDAISNLTIKDVQSISAAFADYDPAAVQNAPGAEGTSCCCCCTPCCSCSAATVIQPIQ